MRANDTKLIAKLMGGVVYSTTAFAGLPLLAAWTFDWWRAWVLAGVVLAASSITMFGIFPSRPDLLDERYRSPIQNGQPLADKILTMLLVLSFLGLVFFIPLDVFRFQLLGRTNLAVAVLGMALFVAGWTLISLALAANAFAAPIVKLQESRGQMVVDTGPYRVVRHPMYAGSIPLMVGMPLWLGSPASALLAMIPLSTLILRVLTEENLLRRQLPGYVDYARKVRWRLIPFVW